MKYTLEKIWFVKPVPHIAPILGNTTYLGPEIANWAAILDTEEQGITLRVNPGKKGGEAFWIPVTAVQLVKRSPTKSSKSDSDE